MILAGDVGGTHTRLGLFRRDAAGRLTPLGAVQEFGSRGFPGLAEVALAFLEGRDGGGGEEGGRARLEAAGFGIPGPVVGQRAVTPNLPWPEIDGARIAARLGLAPERVLLANDLAAAASGLDRVAPGRFRVLQAGAEVAGGARALVSAGTGLGIALQATAPGGGWVTLATEGGHADFAARDEEEWALRGWLARRSDIAGASGGHVSAERLVSGPGLGLLYEFLRDVGRLPPSGEVESALAAGSDPAGAIAAAGAAGQPLCDRVLERFASIYGAVAGNVALLSGATGGVFLGGGVAPKLADRLARGGFLAAFRDKGRFRGYLERIPVRIVLEEHAGLLGAAALAARL